MKNVIKKFDVRKFRMAVIKMAITACTVAMAVCSSAMIAFADNAENTAPTGVGGTNTKSALVNVVFWIIRIAIIIIGGGPSLIKIVQGQTDENTRDRNAGIAGLVITGACFAATFLVAGLI
ncbi:hypothetical protein [Ruminococcus sp.]|uniref:hypothetical protein n=1 Tax=Ruminococcus sp. TaxID=41978 RepID=UPI0025D90860|nr:hypothetical protein [Ruminococcus sp.]MBQ6252476.1 hypothetical protein [Ruminococcus sp.]